MADTDQVAGMCADLIRFDTTNRGEGDANGERERGEAGETRHDGHLAETMFDGSRVRTQAWWAIGHAIM